MIEAISISLLSREFALHPVQGVPLPETAQTVLRDLSGDRPAARKIETGLLISIPLKEGGWVVWLLEKIPDDMSLPELLKTVQSQSAEVLRQQKTAQKNQNPESEMLQAALAASEVKRKNRIALFQNGLMQNGDFGEPIIVLLRAGKIRRFWFSNNTHSSATDELRQIIPAQIKRGELTVTHHLDSGEEDALDGKLVCERLGVKSLSIQLPENGQNGYAMIATNMKVAAETAMEKAPSLIDLFLRKGRARTSKITSWRGAFAWSAAAILVAFLLFPVTLKITATGESIPTRAVTAALASGAYLVEIHVRPGDDVIAGQVLATFRSPELEQLKSEEELNVLVEQINAQDALAQDNYAEFQMAEQRRNIAELRLEQIVEKIAQLTVAAPIDGRITDALPAGMRGRFVDPSTPVAEIQDELQFDLLVKIAGLDAPLISVGQTGEVYFRGLSDETFEIEVVSQPVLREDQQTAETFLEVRARVVDGAQQKLLVGLSGFVKVEVGREPNFIALSRYAVEYVRLFLWKYLGLRA